MDQTYQTKTLLTRAHFYGADPSLANSTGNHFTTNNADHGWSYNVEHITGLTVNVSALNPVFQTLRVDPFRTLMHGQQRGSHQRAML